MKFLLLEELIQAYSTNDSRGSNAGAFSIPTRHIHQVIEMVHKKDVKNCIDPFKILSRRDEST